MNNRSRYNCWCGFKTDDMDAILAHLDTCDRGDPLETGRPPLPPTIREAIDTYAASIRAAERGLRHNDVPTIAESEAALVAAIRSALTPAAGGAA